VCTPTVVDIGTRIAFEIYIPRIWKGDRINICGSLGQLYLQGTMYKIEEDMVTRFEIVRPTSFLDTDILHDTAGDSKALSRQTTSFHGIFSQLCDRLLAVKFRQFDNLRPMVTVIFRHVYVQHQSRLDQQRRNGIGTCWSWHANAAAAVGIISLAISSVVVPSFKGPRIRRSL
jgi:hypothetical protein